jgi:peptidyl-prolyl cis-trans isomerase D
MALGFMRRHRRWLYVFLWLVIAAFIILYIPAFSGSTKGSPGETLATVGGLPIRVGEFQKAYLRQRQFYERMYQGRMDAAMLKRMGLESQVLQSLVTDRLVSLEAKRLGLTIDDETLAKTLATSPEFQENGRFLGADEIRRRLDYQGVSVEEFENQLRNKLLRDRLEALVTDAVSVTPDEVEREFRRRNEQVKAEYVLVDAARFRPGIAVSDDEVKARFEAKRDSYRVPEKRVASYLLVDQEALRPRATVTDNDIEVYFNGHRDEFKQPEQACASHILVKVKSSPEATEGHADDEARKIAEGLLAKVRAGGDFAELAKKSSEDEGSASRGGDLDCFGRGQMVPEFDNAVFAMTPGETSDLVKSSYGYHIIRLASKTEETVPSLSTLRERIRPILVSQKVQTLAGEKAQAITALLGRGRTLEEAAKDQGLTVQKSAPFARGDNPEPLASPALVARAFELKAGETDKEGFDVPRGYAFIAVAEIQPARAAELKDVQDKIKADLAEEKAFLKAKEQAQELKTRAAKADLEKSATALGLVRKETPALTGRSQPLGDLGSGAALDDVAFALPEKVLSDPVRVASGYAVLRVLEKKAFDPAVFEQQKTSLTSSLRQQKKSQLFQSYLEEARQRVTVERHPEAFKRIVG